MNFRQLFEEPSSTYTYLIGCEETGQSLFIDPVYNTAERDLSSILQMQRNPGLGNSKSLEGFSVIMQNLNLVYQKFIDHAVPGNQKCGVCPEDLPENMVAYCGQMTESPQG